MKNGVPHILFLFSDTGGGHRSATEAIIEALTLEYGGRISTEMVDFLKDYAPFPFDRFPNRYPDMVRVPWTWRLGYWLSNGAQRVRLLFRLHWPYVKKAVEKLYDEHPCDLIVSTHPLINDPSLRYFGDDRPPYVVVVTDLVTTHAFWHCPGVDLTIVPSEPARARAVEHGLNPDRVRVVGLPVADRFCRPGDNPREIRQRLGWPNDLPMILLVGGGEGMGPLHETARAIAGSGLEAGMAIVAGRNQGLKRKLEAESWPAPTFVYGFVREMPDFMRAADILVTKAGPGTVSEAFNAGLPMVIYSYLPGQETGNVSYVVENGAGVWAPDPDRIVAALRTWLNHPQQYAAAQAACEALARPDAARCIAQILAERVGVAVG